jgi:D-glycero-D-manno-heptose 1,7-bisphosphate phosphatase
MTQRRFAVLDRDGTINIEYHYLSDPKLVELIPGATNGLRHLQEMGLRLIVVTNQSAVGRGFFDQSRLDLIHQRLSEQLNGEGVHLDGIYVCPHKPEDHCLCRKPNIGLMELAAKELGFDPKACFVIGDKACDIEFGKRVGATTFLVRTGYGVQLSNDLQVAPDYVVDDLLAGAKIIQGLLSRECNQRKDEFWKRWAYGRVKAHMIESMKVKQEMGETCFDSIIASATLIAETFKAGGKVLLCGNGGSAADCQHMAAEFVSRLRKDFDRPGLPAIALTTDTSFLTAFANDCGFEGVFERQVKTFGRPGDLLLGISTSGSSMNVVRAVEAAKVAKMSTIVLTGTNGRLAKMVDIAIPVPSAHTQYIQEVHLFVEHILCDLVEQYLFNGSERWREKRDDY